MKATVKFISEFIIMVLIVLAMLITVQAKAQGLSGGIAGSISTGAVKISEIPDGFADVIKGDNLFGMEAGAFAQLDLDPFYMKPMLMFGFRRGVVEVQPAESSVAATEEMDFEMSRIAIPFLFGLRIIGPLSVNAGPEYNYILHTTDHFNQTDVKLSRGALGYRAGVNAELGRVNLFMHYKGITHSRSETSESKFSAPHELIFGLGVRLGGN